MQNYFKLKPYLEWVLSFRDAQGMLVNGDADGGDCAHNFPVHYMNLDYLNSKTEFDASAVQDFTRDLAMISALNDILGLQPGQYVRHPDTTKWYSKLKYMSRDQTASLLAGMVYFKKTAQIEALQQELFSRNLLHWNVEESDFPYQRKIADPVSPVQLRHFIASIPRLKYYKILLPLLDLDLLYAALLGYKKWDASSKIYGHLLAIDKQNSHSFISRLASWLFKRTNAGQLMEDAYVRDSLAIPPLGFMLKIGFDTWKVS